MARLPLIVALVSLVSLSLHSLTCASEENASGVLPPEVVAFRAGLETLVRQNRLPGVAVGILRDQELIWADGIGYADLENKTPASPTTPYRLASVSKPFAAVLIMQLVEKGKLELNTPMAQFRVPSRYRQKPILIRHVLSHTSEGVPGSVYQYSGDCYSDLTLVIEEVTGKSYPRVLKSNILDPTQMRRSVPGPMAPGYETIIGDLALPYEVFEGVPVRSAYPIVVPNWSSSHEQDWTVVGFLKRTEDFTRREILGNAYTPLHGMQTSGGLVSTITDLAKFDVALDRDRLITRESKEQIFTPAVSNSGKKLPYGLGWFVQQHKGLKLVWHYGEWPPTHSSLYLKVPQKDLTLVILANCAGLSSPYSLWQGNVLASPYATLFLETCVLDEKD